MLSDYAVVGVLLAIVLTIPLGGYLVTYLASEKTQCPQEPDV